ncbi:MAG TPA: hypothetical protein ENH10_10855, partial [Bacteroidetes bacterium]|nr:hypothetical protein [Bacteroidota bacterium]HEX05632.1 hypothetical protein [Bacteroidota bacterium]
MTDKPALPRPEDARYYEEQRLRQLWLKLVFWAALVLTILSPWLDGLNHPEKRVETFLTMGIGGPVMLLLILAIYRMRMRVWVMEDAIHVRFWPLIGHKIIP